MDVQASNNDGHMVDSLDSDTHAPVANVETRPHGFCVPTGKPNQGRTIEPQSFAARKKVSTKAQNSDSMLQ